MIENNSQEDRCVFEFFPYPNELVLRTRVVFLKNVAEKNMQLGLKELKNDEVFLYTGLSLIQQGIELYLKALLCLKGIDITKTHELSLLLREASNECSGLDVLNEPEIQCVLEQIGGSNFSRIRYGEGCMRFNKRKSKEKPEKVLEKIIEKIHGTLKNIYDGEFEIIEQK